MRRAARTDAVQTAIVKALRKAGCAVISLARLGAGVPDLLARRGKNYFLIECKSKGGRLTPAQMEFQKHWIVHVCTTPEEALRAVGL